jgi:predicted DNA-binding protein with PD1-like motif
MIYKQFKDKVIVRIDKGEELIHSLKQLCKTLGITFGAITGIGATDNATIGLLNTKTQKYQSTSFTGDHEISSLIGTVTIMDGDVYLHLHTTICNSEHIAYGGHLSSAVISATFEGIIDVIEGSVKRVYDPTVGLNLLQF